MAFISKGYPTNRKWFYYGACLQTETLKLSKQSNECRRYSKRASKGSVSREFWIKFRKTWACKWIASLQHMSIWFTYMAYLLYNKPGLHITLQNNAKKNYNHINTSHKCLPCKQSCRGKAAHTGRPCRRPGTPHTPGRPGHRSPARSPKGDAHHQRETPPHVPCDLIWFLSD